MKNFFLGILLILFLIASVNAHGVHVTTGDEDFIIIANESNGVFVKSVVDDLGYNVSVYNFKTEDDVIHELAHASENKDKKILVLAYQDSVSEYLMNNSELSNRVIVSSADENSIKNNLNILINGNQGNSQNFLANVGIGLLLGLIIGSAITVAIFKRRN